MHGTAHVPRKEHKPTALVVALGPQDLHCTMTAPRTKSALGRLVERAALCGIDSQFKDAFGQRKRANPEVLSRLLRALETKGEPAPRILPRTVVIRQGRANAVIIKGPVSLELRWEIVSDQTVATGNCSPPRLTFPMSLPIGLFRLRVTPIPGDLMEEATLIVCPARAYQGEESAPRRMWALAVQLYGVRSARNWGHGDFTDLLALIDLAADLGASGVGLNPLHALFDDRPTEPSPYFPSSRLFLNPLYIDLEAVPEFPGTQQAPVTDLLAAARDSTLVDYPAVAAAKRRGLELAYDRFQSRGTPERRDAFDRFRQARGPVLAKFACFEALRRRFAAPWWEWPAPWRIPPQADLDDLRRDETAQTGFFEFVQWQAHQQLERCRQRARERGLPIGLYLDVAVGVRRDGFDAWCDHDAILSETTIGAPPDHLNRSGQDWGLAAFNPLALEAQQFEPYRHMLEAAMQYAGAIRLDHVLGLKRLFLVPTGMTPVDGTYVRYPFEGLLAVTALASAASECIVIGEDLGTVPEGLRETLADWGLWSYQVMLFERSKTGAFRPPASYREDALVTFATHDLPTYSGWLEGRDLAVKRTLGLATETDAQRQAAFDALKRALNRSSGELPDFTAVAGFLADTPSRLFVAPVEDLLGVRDQVNLPGTIDTHPNWRQRLPVALEDWGRHEGVRSIAAVMRAAGRCVSG
jgi:4-alpha-glucanotransferase